MLQSLFLVHAHCQNHQMSVASNDSNDSSFYELGLCVELMAVNCLPDQGAPPV